MVEVKHKAVLIVIDGWGVASERSPKNGDAIAAAKTPVMDAFGARESRTAQGYVELEASSNAVGLPDGLMGNSEVGHLNIGAGRVVWQDVVRIDDSLKKGTFNKNAKIKRSFERAANGNGRLHLLGLISDGGVHSHINHLVGLLKVAKEMKVPEVFIHFFGDGRDTDPKSAAGYMADLLKHIEDIGIGAVATVVGRYYAMDRDKRWDRVEIALNGIVHGKGETSTNPVEAIKKRYEEGENDEFLKPIIVGGPDRRLKDDDTVFFFNYRSDRMREITQLIGDADRTPKPDFEYPKNLDVTTMTRYKTEFQFPVAFEPQRMGNVLAEWLSKQGVKQCHIAETEKYAHVTFFFNGGVEKQFDGEHRDLIASPKVATYDKEPAMSCKEVAEKMCDRIREGEYEFVMNNFAPPDMVGHTGVYDAAVEAVTATDEAIGMISQACKDSGYLLFVTSDHGNAEEMLNEEGKPKTSHTTNFVPFVLANAPENWTLGQENGILADVAPTILAAMGLEQPEEMDGHSLLHISK